MATYQSILLHIIFALLIAKDKATFDLSLRYHIQPDEYDLLAALVRSCRQWGMFFYPNMLVQYSSNAPLALIWMNVGVTKRFGLALYKVCRVCTCSGKETRGELLSLADLSFSMPDSDDVWNAPPGEGSEIAQNVASQANLRDNIDPKEWISEASTVLYDTHVDFDWI